jgi:phosphatidylglycerophosphate synthase
VEPETARRPLKVRSRNWPRQLATRLVHLGLTPNQISLASVAFGGVGAALLCLCPDYFAAPRAALFVGAAACIQARLVCNLLDGLMAVEGGLKTKSGEIFNEFPDRVADVLLFLAAGYSMRHEGRGAIELGYLCAIASVLTAYVRVFGGSAGLPQDFCGPMAKQQRMATLTVACVLSAIEAILLWHHRVMFLALAVILVGTLFTAARRTRRIYLNLEAR